MRREQVQKQNKQQSTSNLQKISKFLYTIFCGSSQIDVNINRSIVFNTYIQIAQFIHILSLYTWFNKTNNYTYDAVQSVFSGLLIAICIIPRVNNKHYGLLLTLISFFCITIAGIAGDTILIINYFTFTNYCSILEQYSLTNISFVFKAQQICSEVINYYWMNLGGDAVTTLLRIIYLYMIFKAYHIAKSIFNQQEKRRRRKQRFDQNRKNKNPYNAYRKI